MTSYLTLLLTAVLFTGCGADEPADTPAPDTAPATAALAVADELPSLTVYKPTYCGCCSGWVEHMQQAGFDVVVEEMEDPAAVKAELGVPNGLESCHSAVVDGYVIEGHVPADVVLRMLRERPDIEGLAVPGMPVGTPGMETPDDRHDPYDVVAFDASGSTGVFESR